MPRHASQKRQGLQSKPASECGLKTVPDRCLLLENTQEAVVHTSRALEKLESSGKATDLGRPGQLLQDLATSRVPHPKMDENASSQLTPRERLCKGNLVAKEAERKRAESPRSVA